MAVGHYQFETIHPFTDGNGCTGRVLNGLFPELVHLIFEMPYCRIQNLVEAKICERQAASRYLKQLVAIGVLVEKAAG